MTPASAPRPDPLADRLLVVGVEGGRLEDHRIAELPRLLEPGDLVVVNDSATLPASLRARGPRGEVMEVRIARVLIPELACVDPTEGAPGWRGGDEVAGDPASSNGSRFELVLFGEGDYRTRTENRQAPPPVGVGDELVVGRELIAHVEAVSQLSSRLVTVRFDREGAALWRALYRDGRPVQYAHVPEPLALWDVQTAYAGRPWSVEMPSAGRPLTWKLLAQLQARRVELARLTHAAGISATGDDALDASLPLAERYEIPERTIALIAETHARGGRVVAVGTSVVRALESSAAEHGVPRAETAVTTLRIGPGFMPRVVDGLMTGIHEPGTSHRALLTAFASEALLDRAYALALGAGYLGHELGDSMLILPR